MDRDSGERILEIEVRGNAAGAVGGYYVVEVDTMEEAIALAARVPAARLGGAVEVRPAQAYW